MEFKCRFKSCPYSESLSPTSARIEVKSALPKGGLKKVEGRLAVNWKKNGEAVFHPVCWRRLVAAARKRKKKSGASGNKPGLDIFLIDCEKVMIKEASKTEEIFDAEESVKDQARRVAGMIKAAKHCVFFTGAGISTAAGLGDFRGKGGKWTEEDRETITLEDDDDNDDLDPPPAKRARSVGKKNASTSKNPDLVENDDKEDEEEQTDYEDLRPTFTHEAIRQLMDDNHVKYLISQNCDGLHLLSGVPPSKISELHGNVFVERCEKCNKPFRRPYYVCDDIGDLYLEEMADFGKSNIIVPKFMKKCELCGLSHRTGRRCDIKGCGGHLADTIINFCDDLEADILNAAFDSAKSCDLLICLGTTLAVTPACNIVHHIKKPRRIVICNRQVTEKDDESLKLGRDGTPLGARVHGDCDVFMRHMMQALMGHHDFQTFSDSLPARRRTYDKQRTTSDKGSI